MWETAPPRMPIRQPEVASATVCPGAPTGRSSPHPSWRLLSYFSVFRRPICLSFYREL